MDEIQVQADMLQGLGLNAESNAMQGQHGLVDQALQTARQPGDTTQGYKDLGTVKAQARAVMRAPVEQDAVNGMLAAIPKLLDKIDHHLDRKDLRNAKLDGRLQALRNDFYAMTAATPKGEVEKVEKNGRALLKDVLNDSYGGDRYLKGDIPDMQAAVYREMLKARYDITAEVPPSPGLDKFYDALSLVPATHVAHTSLMKVEIINDKDKDAVLGDYASTGKKIRVNVGKVKKRPTVEYEMGGTKSKVNTLLKRSEDRHCAYV